MAIADTGEQALYFAFADPECHFAQGGTGTTLWSTGFGSCVGLVLYSSAHKRGVVAHFAGSLGLKQHREKAKDDTLQITRAIGTWTGDWKAWVFGGDSLVSTSDFADSPSVERLTKPLIRIVREQLHNNPHITIDSDRSDPEMMDDEFVGHKGVSLKVANGEVTWDDD